MCDMICSGFYIFNKAKTRNETYLEESEALRINIELFVLPILLVSGGVPERQVRTLLMTCF